MSNIQNNASMSQDNEAQIKLRDNALCDKVDEKEQIKSDLEFLLLMDSIMLDYYENHQFSEQFHRSYSDWSSGLQERLEERLGK